MAVRGVHSEMTSTNTSKSRPRALSLPRASSRYTFSKVLYTLTLHRTYTTALTFENVGQAIMEFLINERDPRAMGPQCIQRESCLPGTSSQKSSIY
jgi:hypothetical protein